MAQRRLGMIGADLWGGAGAEPSRALAQPGVVIDRYGRTAPLGVVDRGDMRRHPRVEVSPQAVDAWRIFNEN